ncbi:hypothetical protein ACLGI4_00420 [Streptomyces sp. HMX112]|uniref:hypothetical protein n=1 Tax=Streptomyces sp. HMX112 TaxID=3390850 RepID=UPI003A804F81
MSDAPPRTSVAVMCHPARRDRVADLVAALHPLRPRLVWDPDPGAGPSPLRTAKLAWSDVEPWATHHLVLQDDVTLVPGFASHLASLVRSREKDAIALYVNWNSPHNAYHVRCAAVAGSPWAPLTLREWVPTLGLVLPAEEARGLAAYLKRFPDSFCDEDELVAEYCEAAGISVVATVPHLLEHGTGPSVAGNDAHGRRKATVFAGEARVPDGHWAAHPGLSSFPSRPVALQHPFSVELVASRCGLRILRGQAGEPVEHPFNWGWRDWAPLIGADPLHIADSLRERTTTPRGNLEDGRPAPRRPWPERVRPLARTRLEVWAAGYLLGLDVASAAWPAPAAGQAAFAAWLRDEALRTWIVSGLTERDADALEEAGVEDLVRLCADAVGCGTREGHRRGGARPA